MASTGLIAGTSAFVRMSDSGWSAISLQAAPVFGTALVVLLGRAIYLSRTEPPVAVTRTVEVEMEHPDRSPETLY